MFALTLVAALGCGLMAGVFFAFSAFVMRALNRLPPAEAVAAMRAINVAAVTPPFLVALVGTGAACALLAVLGRHDRDLLAGSALYLVGTILLTVAYHVPRNDALAAGTAGGWADYAAGWTRWNHVRGAAALAAAAVLTLAL